MKKRILALALAGTTAFSVFGSAISANAAYNSVGDANTTDTYYNVDAYVSYEPVAETIVVTEATVTPGNTEYYIKDDNGDFVKQANEAAFNNALAEHPDIRKNYTTLFPVAVMNGNGYYYVSDDYKSIIGTGTNGNYTTGDLESVEGFLNVLGISKITATGQYTVAGVTISDSSSNLKPFDSLQDAIDAAAKKNKEAIKDAGNLYILKSNNTKRYTSTTAFNEAVKYEDKQDFILNSGKVMIKGNPDTSDDNYSITVTPDVDGDNTVSPDDWTNWTFNSDMTGESTVYPFTVTSTLVKEHGVTYLKSEKTEVPTIYAYDFIPETIPDSSVSNVANNWNADDLKGTTNAIGSANMAAETGRGSQNSGSIRYDVVTEWINFLNELAINKDNTDYAGNPYFGNYYNQNWDAFCANYTDRFYNDPQFDINTGAQIDPVKVDLYNIKGLLKDIWELSAKKADGASVTGWETANTSELVYLMQQYDKYIGNYIDKTEVASDDWGDLLLSILDAATADDFANATEYRLYTQRVEDLRAAYELATTVGMINNAEQGMYDLLAKSLYTAKTTDKTALGATLKGLYFNVGSAPAEYSVDPSTLSPTNFEYSNYNYLVAAVSGKSSANTKDDTLKFTSTLGKGYYSLYPADDYKQNSNTAYQFAGNDVRGTAGATVGTYADTYGVSVTDEYEWFLNVYELAVNMNAGNTRQGSIDAVNEALNAAVADLAVTTTPSAMDVGAMNDAVEKYAGKIDTDYVEGYYNKYVQANDYAENVAEGKWQTRIAAMITGVAGEALTYQGTQVTVTKNDMKTVETAIKNGKTALEAIKADKDYNAAQVTALNKAIDNAQYLVDLYEGTYSKYKDDQSVNHVYTYYTGDKDQMVKSDLTKAIEAIDAAINYSEIVMGWSQNDAGKWMYGTEEGYLNNGWNKIGKTWFYFNADNTAKQSEWFQENGTWYWFNSNCGAATGWAKVDGEWYFFKGNNAMKTGWEKVDGNWYYMASSGKMVTGWCEVNGKWYYFSKESNSLGQMLYSTTVDGYKLGADGAWIK